MAEDPKPSSDKVWRCPPEATRGAAQWVSDQDPSILPSPHVIEHIWTEVSSIDASALDPAVTARLAELQLRPRLRYETLAWPDRAAPKWEHWLSEDGVTSATISVDDECVVAIETRLEDGMLQHLLAVPETPLAQIEYFLLGEDVVADYLQHREVAQQRVEAGERALTVADPCDRRIFLEYYTKHMSPPPLVVRIAEFPSLADRIAELPQEESGKNGFGFLMIASAFGTLFAIVGLIFWWRAPFEWLLTWWPIVAIAIAPQVGLKYVNLLFRGHMNHLDGKFPDSLDHHAGFWLKEQAVAEGLVDLEVGKAKESHLVGLDAYLPMRRKIILGEKTYEKQDPTFWAIAAHELGHALAYTRRPSLTHIMSVARVGFRRLLGLYVAVLLTNIFLGWDVANEVWRWLAAGAALAGALVLVDEAVASTIGMRILRAEPRIAPSMHGDLRRHLWLAFATYAAPVVVLLGVVAGSGWIARYIQSHADFEPATPGSPVIANILAAAVLGLAVFRGGRGLVARLRPDGTKEDEWVAGCLLGLAGLMVNGAFFLSVWDQPLGPEFRAAVLLFSPMVTFLFIPAVLPVLLGLNLPAMVIEKLGWVPSPPEQARSARAQEAVRDVASTISVNDPRAPRSWAVSLASPGVLFFVLPLVVLWWASQL